MKKEKTLKEKIDNAFSCIQYYVEIEENRSSCTGQCDDYCRCTTISPSIKSIRYDRIINEIVQKIETIKDYCIERLLRKGLRIDKMIAYGIGGYYGEESMVAFTDDSFIEELNSLSNMTDREAVEHILTKDYGYVLDSIAGKDWKLEKVDIKDIIVGYNQINQEIVESYQEAHIPVLCVSEGSKFRLIDGIHRYSAYRKRGDKTIRIVYC